MIENERTEEEVFNNYTYLLNDTQYKKFSHLLEEKTNLDYIESIKQTSLVHSKRFFPISAKEYDKLIHYIKKNIEDKKKLNEIDNSTTTESFSTTTTTTTTTPTTTTTTITTISTLPITTTTTTTTTTLTTPTTTTTTTTIAKTPLTSPSTSLNLSKSAYVSKSKVWKPLIWYSYLTKKK